MIHLNFLRVIGVTSATGCAFRLRRALGGTVRTKNTAIAGRRLEHLFAALAFVKENARIRRHRFDLLVAAFGAGYYRFSRCFRHL